MGRTILIADDSPTVQKKASGILTGEGIEVVTVSNGVAAVKKIAAVKPMVILADVSMPGKDGYEVCEFVKRSAEYPNVPVVLVFSDDDIYDEQKGARAGADGRIRKPFDPSELIRTVTKFLAVSEAAQKPVDAAIVYKTAPGARLAPPPAPVVEPMDDEPEFVTKKPEPDLSTFEGGVAFGETPLEEAAPSPAESAPAFESAAAFERQPAFEPPPESPPSFESGAPLEASAPAATPEFPPPPSEEPASSEAAAEPAPVSPQQEPVPAEPVFIEEQAAPPPPPSPPAPESGRTMMFRLGDIAQPVLSDEMAPAAAERASAELAEAAARVPAVAESGGVAPTEEGEPPVSAASLESYSLSEAAAGHVRFAAPAEEAVEATMAEEAAPSVAETAAPEPAGSVEAAPTSAGASAPAAFPVDAEHVYTIVHLVVTKMSPRLHPQAIADMAKNLADEINAELNASSPPSS